MENKLTKKPRTMMEKFEGDLLGVSFRSELRKVLGKINPDHFVRVALTAMQKNPKIAECSPVSVFQSILDCASCGLELDGRRAHLVPYNTKKGMVCQLIIDYKGYVDLITRPGKGNDVGFIDAAIVYDKDDFVWDMNRVVRHRFDIHSDDRGKPIAAYVAINFKNGQIKYELMMAKEIISIKDRSKAVIAYKRYGGDCIWTGPDEMEMWKKCPLRRATKWIPINDQTARALEVDGDRFEDLGSCETEDPPATPLKSAAPSSLNSGTPEEDHQESPEHSDHPEEEESPPPREPGQDDDDDDGAESPPAQQTYTGPRKELRDKLMAYHRKDEAAVAKHLQALSKYKSKKTGEMKPGRTDVNLLTDGEATFALRKLNEELGG